MESDDELDSLLELLHQTNDDVQKDEIKPSTSTSISAPKLRDISIFSNNITKTNESNVNLLHRGDTDTSDDEEARNHNYKYNSYGKEIKSLLENNNSQHSSSSSENSFSFNKDTKELSWKSTTPIKDITKREIAAYDPFFGIRISNPIISSEMLKERMVGRRAIPIRNVQQFVQREDNKNTDWVVAGAIVCKSDTKISQKGSQYIIWTISDLKDDLKTVAMFLFKNAYKNLWKTTQGTVVAVLNPGVLDRRKNSKDEATLSIDNPDRVMLLGQSKDLGFCKSKKKNGELCNTFINTRICEFCIYHVKQEYQKFSRRSDLQTSVPQGNGLIALRNKVLGKNEVFYAGKSYTAIKNNKKLREKDEKLLETLKGFNANRIQNRINPELNKKKLTAAHVEVSSKQRAKDLERLKLLGAPIDPLELSSEKQIFKNQPSSTVTLEQSKENAKNVLSKLKSKQTTKKDEVDLTNVPKIDLNSYKSSPICLDLNKGTEKENKKATKTITPAEILETRKSIFENIKNSKENANKIEKIGTSSEIMQIKQKRIPVEEKYKKPSEIMSTPKISNSNQNTPVLKNTSSGQIDLSSFTPAVTSPSFNRRLINNGRLNALKYVAQNGPIEKRDPMNLKGNKNKKRLLLDKIDENDSERKRLKMESDEVAKRAKIKQIIEAKSANEHLIEHSDAMAQEKYFDTLEKKERLEEKMMNTFKVACKAVRCLKCKYTNFSASDLCKQDGHPLKVIDATKRFFKCTDCSNRTVTLDLIPLHECAKCGGTKWIKTSMMKEKIVNIKESLSIRGDEEMFIGTAVTTNINLLVPE